MWPKESSAIERFAALPTADISVGACKWLTQAGGAGTGDKHNRPVFAAIRRNIEEECIMLWTIAVVLIILWLLGMITSTTIGGFIHVLLVIAAIVVLVQIIKGRR